LLVGHEDEDVRRALRRPSALGQRGAAEARHARGGGQAPGVCERLAPRRAHARTRETAAVSASTVHARPPAITRPRGAPPTRCRARGRGPASTTISPVPPTAARRRPRRVYPTPLARRPAR